jgi:hypothetical protein
MFSRKCGQIGISTLAFLVAAALFAQPNTTPKVELSIVSAERKDSKSCTVKWAIVNHREHPILFPRSAVGSWVYTIEIEQLDREKGWTTLPADHEWTHSESDPIKLGPGETYRYSFDLPDDFTVPRWITFPRPAYSIPLNTELRLNVTYFEDEKDWEAYLAELKTGSPHWGRMEPLLRKWGQQAFSEPFKLPPAKPNGGDTSPGTGDREPGTGTGDGNRGQTGNRGQGTGDRRDVFSLLIFPHVSTGVSNELAPAQPLQILPLPPTSFECQLSNPESYVVSTSNVLRIST